MDLSKRFSFGVNLDDTWRYTPVAEPKSIIFPHLLSIGLREGRRFEATEEATILLHHQAIPKSEAGRAALALGDALKAIGADFVRCWFPWRFFEPTPVPYESLDSLLQSGYASWPTDGLVESLKSQGISILPVIACGYDRMLPRGVSPDAGEEEYLKRVHVHARLLVRHYKDSVDAWQLENEPNWWRMHEAGGWRRGGAWVEGEEFRESLLKTLGDAVREEDPSALTMVNLEADEEKVDPRQYSGLCDVLGLDFYPNYRSAIPVDASAIRRARGLAAEAGKPVMVAETGYPSGPSALGYTRANQADYVERALREAHAVDAVTGVGIWRYIDTSWRSFPPQENHFGLVDEKEGPKEAWYRYGQVVKELR